MGDLRNAVLGRADKGILLTTSSFTKSAKEEANRPGVDPIELVDGERLVEMFEQVQLGVVPRTVFDVDEEYLERFK